MRLIKKLLRLLFKVPYKSKKSNRLKWAIINFYDEYDVRWSFNSYRITKIRFYDYPKLMTIEIHSLSPGLIIGEGGRAIDRLKNLIAKVSGKPVKIDLQETNPFK